MIRARWRQDGSGSSVLLVGGQPFGEVSTRRGKPGFDAALLLPSGLQRRTLSQREAAETFLLEGVEDYVLRQLTPAARCVLLRLFCEPLSSTVEQQASRAAAV